MTTEISFSLRSKKYGRVILRYFGYRTLVKTDHNGKMIGFISIRGNTSAIETVIDLFMKDGWIEETS